MAFLLFEDVEKGQFLLNYASERYLYLCIETVIHVRLITFAAWNKCYRMSKKNQTIKLEMMLPRCELVGPIDGIF